MEHMDYGRPPVPKINTGRATINKPKPPAGYKPVASRNTSGAGVKSTNPPKRLGG